MAALRLETGSPPGLSRDRAPLGVTPSRPPSGTGHAIDCPHCADKDAEIEYLKGELGLLNATWRLITIQRALKVQPAVARLILSLAAVKGRTLSRWHLIEAIGSESDGKIIDINVCAARKSLGHDAIENVRGQGYRMTPIGLAKVQAIEPDASSITPRAP